MKVKDKKIKDEAILDKNVKLDTKETIDKVSMVTGVPQDELKAIFRPMDRIYKLALESLKRATEIIDEEIDDDNKKFTFLAAYFVLSLNMLDDEDVKKMVLKTMNKSGEFDASYVEFLKNMDKV